MNIKGLVDNAQLHFEVQPFTILNMEDMATFAFPYFTARATVDSLGLPQLGNAGDMLSLRNFLLEVKKDSAGISMDLHGRLYILNNN